MNRDMIADIEAFRDKYGFNAIPLTRKDFWFRLALMEEEMNELRHAMHNHNAEEVVDAYIDLIYIAFGSLKMAGIDVNKAWTEVHRANMAKERGIKPGREQSGGVDVFKPAGWVAPSHTGNHGDLPSIFGEEHE